MRVRQQVAERTSALADTVRLASRSQLLGSLHAMAAHDFRDSLNSMTINVELLSRTLESGGARGSDAAVQERCISAIRRELKRLEQSTGRALDETRNTSSEVRRVDLGAIVESVVFLLRRSAERQRISLTFYPPTQTIEVIGEPDELRHAFFNVAINAIEAMSNGGELRFELSAEGPAAVVSITDTGTGIPVDMDARVWDLFFTTKPQGLGLGLHVVKTVAESHGGSATLDPSESGVRFEMRLPIVT